MLLTFGNKTLVDVFPCLYNWEITDYNIYNQYLKSLLLYRIRGTFGVDFNLAVWLPSLNLMYANTTYITCIMKRHEAMYAPYHPVHQTKMSTNVGLRSNSPNLLPAYYTAYTVAY